MRRDRHDILKDMLIIAAPKGGRGSFNVSDGAIESSIMSYANLSFHQFKSCLNQLMYPKDKKPPLITRDDKGIHKTTSEGLEFLEYYFEMEKTL